MTVYVEVSSLGYRGSVDTEEGRKFFFAFALSDLVRKFSAWSGYAARDIRIVRV